MIYLIRRKSAFRGVYLDNIVPCIFYPFSCLNPELMEKGYFAVPALLTQKSGCSTS